MNNQPFYDAVAEELQHRRLRAGLWARAVAETGSEGDAARALYIRLRVAELAQIEQAETQRRAAEEAREAEIRAHKEQELRRPQELEERARIGWSVVAIIVLWLLIMFVFARLLSR